MSTEHALDSAIRDLFAGSGPKLLEVVVERPGAA